VGHFAIIVNTNHFPELPQREARRNSIVRRFNVCQHHIIFDDASIENPADRAKRPDLIDKLINDDAAMSCILKWALEGAARVVVRRGYTPVAEDLACLMANLGEQDIISEFFESIGGVYGEGWHHPCLYHFQNGDEFILFPAWHDCDTRYPLSRVVDKRTDKPASKYDTCVGNTGYPLHLINETRILYRLYADFCKDAGSNAILTRKNFKLELRNSGFTEIRVVDPFKRRVQLIVPAGTEDSAAGFARFRKEQEDIFCGVQKAPDAEPDVADSADADNKWQSVEDMSRDAGVKYHADVISKWAKNFDGKSIDDIVNGNIGINVDHDALMSVLRIGIRAVQTTHGFNKEGYFHD
jgi:hypothetical protein